MDEIRIQFDSRRGGVLFFTVINLERILNVIRRYYIRSTAGGNIIDGYQLARIVRYRATCIDKNKQKIVKLCRFDASS